MLAMQVQAIGFSEPEILGIGCLWVLYCGYMENASSSPPSVALLLMTSPKLAGAGKSILWSVFFCCCCQGELTSLVSSRIIEYIEAKCTAGSAFMGYFYFDSGNKLKRNRLNMVPSLLMQLATRSTLCCDTLFRSYLAHNNGTDVPRGAKLTECLKEMVSIPGYVPIYLVLDGLNECPDSPGVPSPREEVLGLIKELVQLRRPNLHLCVVSRFEADIRAVLEPLATSMSLDETPGHKRDIITYINAVVHSDRRIQGLRADDKQLIMDKLPESADGMLVPDRLASWPR
jgi:hypothetical protein